MAVVGLRNVFCPSYLGSSGAYAISQDIDNDNSNNNNDNNNIASHHNHITSLWGLQGLSTYAAVTVNAYGAYSIK